MFEGFRKRFALLDQFDLAFKVSMRPFDFSLEEAPKIFQLELIDLQASTELKHLFRRLDKIQIYSGYVDEEKFLHLRRKAMRVAASMRTTCIRESFFQS